MLFKGECTVHTQEPKNPNIQSSKNPKFQKSKNPKNQTLLSRLVWAQGHRRIQFQSLDFLIFGAPQSLVFWIFGLLCYEAVPCPRMAACWLAAGCLAGSISASRNFLARVRKFKIAGIQSEATTIAATIWPSSGACTVADISTFGPGRPAGPAKFEG